MNTWIVLGGYEHEVSENGKTFTGWYRCVGGRLVDGRWPEWNSSTGEERFSGKCFPGFEGK